MSWLRRRPVPVIVLGSSALGGAAYRYLGLPSDSSAASLNPHTFTPYTLVDKQPVSSTSAIFTLRNNSNGVAADPQRVADAWERSVWSIQIKQPQLQIARAYTPLPPITSEHENARELRLLIRHETGGEVSTYLHRLPTASTVELRGPHAELELPDHVKEVVFLAGGTGIAPAMQIAHALGKRPGCRMHMLWANRRREDCVGGVSDESDGDGDATGWFANKSFSWRAAGPTTAAAATTTTTVLPHAAKGAIVAQLDALKQRDETALHVQYFVDEERTAIQPRDVLRRITQPTLDTDAAGSRLLIVSGPEGFLEHWAGKKQWVGGRETQGPLGGQLARMKLGGWKVIKL